MKRPELKMSIQNRAKQFLSFAALGDMEEILREKEIRHECVGGGDDPEQTVIGIGRSEPENSDGLRYLTSGEFLI